MILTLWAALAGCHDDDFAVVSIYPIYGWVDGCNAVQVSGHGFDKDISVTIGGNPVESIEWASAALDQGYLVTGIAPAASEGAKGYADISATSAGETSTLTETAAYYYVECPAVGYLESAGPAEAVAAGDAITLSGCGIDPAAVFARFVDAAGETQGADLPLTAACGTAISTIVAPTLADGTYYLELVDASGAVLAGTPCPPADSGDTGSSCTSFPVTFGAGGAQ